MADLTKILQNALSGDLVTRQAAEAQLAQAEEQNIALYVVELAKHLSSDDKPDDSRQMAGVMLKNVVSSKDKQVDLAKAQKWHSLDPALRKDVKDKAVTALKTLSSIAQKSACQVVTKLSRLELPNNGWNDLLPLLQNMVIEGEIHWKKAALVTIGYMCEDFEEDGRGDLLTQGNLCNNILTTVVQGMRDPDAGVRLAATGALYHALLFAERNFEVDEERNYIFKVILDNLESQPGPDDKLLAAAWACLSQIAERYYEHLENYMERIAPLSFSTMDNFEHAHLPLEFWSTVCEREYEIQQFGIQDVDRNFGYIQKALSFLLPKLFETMAQQESEDADQDDWTLAKMGACCLALCAKCVGDNIVDPVLKFVGENFGNESWKKREAAVAAYGFIMDGPTSTKLNPVISTSFEPLCNALKDNYVTVRDTTARTIGQIAEHHTISIVNTIREPPDGLISVLLDKLLDKPRVARNVCWALDRLAARVPAITDDELIQFYHQLPVNPPRAAMTAWFPKISVALMQVAERTDAGERDLRGASYDALSTLVQHVDETDAVMDTMLQCAGQLTIWLERTFSLAHTEEVSHFQGKLCGCLNQLIQRLAQKMVSPAADRLFDMFMQIQNPDGPQSVAGKEALMAASSLARVMKESFLKHYPKFSKVLIKGIKSHEDVTYCKLCVTIYAELAGLLGPPAVREECDPLLSSLLDILKSKEADKLSLKPFVMVAIGDLAISLNDLFAQYLPGFEDLLQQAARTRVEDGPEDNEEWLEYIVELRDGVLAAYTGILYGLGDSGKLDMFKAHVANIFELITVIVDDYAVKNRKSDSNLIGALNVSFDLVSAYKKDVIMFAQTNFYDPMLKAARESNNAEIISKADQLVKLVSVTTREKRG